MVDQSIAEKPYTQEFGTDPGTMDRHGKQFTHTAPLWGHNYLTVLHPHISRSLNSEPSQLAFL